MANATKFYAYDVGVASNWFSAIWMLTRCMKQAGWIYKASSDGVAKDTTGVAANDKWGGGGTPTNDAYPTALSPRAGPWWLASGPGKLKFAITAASAGTFLAGEPVSQATSGATGELVGYVYDATNNGWIVVAPRTGTFDGTHVITGAVSTATVTPTTLQTYTQEVLFWKSTTDAQTGNIYWIYTDAVNDSASLFSTLVSAAGCTATIGPGGGGTGNAFPTAAIAILGTGGVANGPVYWSQATGATITTHAQLSAVNATASAGISADGSFWSVFPDGVGAASVIGLFHLDDGEPGDVCPWEWYSPSSGTTPNTSFSRTASGGRSSSTTWANWISNYVEWVGYIARGLGTPGTPPDVASYHAPSFSSVSQGKAAQVYNTAGVMAAQNHPGVGVTAVKPMAVETIGLYNGALGLQQFKGRVRWMRYASLGALYDTTDNKTWVVWFSSSATQPAIYVGPWDGSTPPAP